MGFITSIAASISQATGMDLAASGFTAGLVCGVLLMLILKRRSSSNSSVNFGVENKERPAPFSTYKEFRTTIGGSSTITVDGRDIELKGPEMQQLTDCLARGNKIEAIKILREKTGLGLKEAKGIVDALDAAGKGR